MGRAGLTAALAAAALCGCSPVYVLQSAAGHWDLLARRRDVSAALSDPRTPAALRGPLLSAQQARRFAIDRLGLAASRDFTTYAAIDRPAVTYLVTGSSRVKLEAYQWRFPLAGRFPYKGYFKRSRAIAERDRLERLGWDASVAGAAAYNTPLPLSDPLPSPVLSFSTGALAALLIHEYSHGTVAFKDRMEFNEAAAEFVGRRGADQYLSERFGADSQERRAYQAEREADAAVDAAFERLRVQLEGLYARGLPEAEVLTLRAPVFAQALAELKALGAHYGTLNNAAVVAHGIYHSDLPFEAMLERCGGDLRRMIAELKSLDARDPAADLRRRAQR